MNKHPLTSTLLDHCGATKEHRPIVAESPEEQVRIVENLRRIISTLQQVVDNPRTLIGVRMQLVIDEQPERSDGTLDIVNMQITDGCTERLLDSLQLDTNPDLLMRFAMLAAIRGEAKALSMSASDDEESPSACTH